jgi:hypothetical protein
VFVLISDGWREAAEKQIPRFARNDKHKGSADSAKEDMPLRSANSRSFGCTSLRLRMTIPGMSHSKKESTND